MAKIISIANQKGGVGKTTTAVNLSGALAYLGRKVLLIDMDPQGNASRSVGIDAADVNESLYHVLTGQAQIENVIRPTSLRNMFVLPASMELAGADLEIASSFQDKQYRLKKQLDRVSANYDYVIIDCPPSLGLLNVNALVASNSVLIPLQCEYYAMEGLAQLLSTIRKIKQTMNSDIEIEGVLLTMADFRTKFANEVASEIRKFFKEKVYETSIPRQVKLSEAPSKGKTIVEYSVNSKGGVAYIDLAREVILRGKK
jgi:chromosome partitioning protein